MSKTKRVDGQDLSSRCFAFVGDESDTNSWKFPIHFPGDEAKTKNHIKNSLVRFAETGGIPECERVAAWLILFGAARSHGIPVQLTQKQYDDLCQQWQAAVERV